MARAPATRIEVTPAIAQRKAARNASIGAFLSMPAWNAYRPNGPAAAMTTQSRRKIPAARQAVAGHHPNRIALAVIGAVGQAGYFAASSDVTT